VNFQFVFERNTIRKHYSIIDQNNTHLKFKSKFKIFLKSFRRFTDSDFTQPYFIIFESKFCKNHLEDLQIHLKLKISFMIEV
jgi:hypothetical protein